MTFIGKNVIENLTTAMYENLLVVYREYVQNAADSIDKAVNQGLIDKKRAEIYIDIDKNKGTVSIEDNGVGIGAAKFKSIMSSIADSPKDPAESKGVQRDWALRRNIRVPGTALFMFGSRRKCKINCCLECTESQRNSC